MSFAEKLQSLRKSKGMSQESLAEAIGVSRQAISKWESGQSLPETDKLVSLSRLLDASVDNLLDDAEIKLVDIGTEHTDHSDYKYARHYEYKSKRMLFNLPLVHVNVGRGIHVAKGIVAIGNIALGIVSVGGVALGGIAVGGISLGLLTLAGLALGLLFSAGGISIGAIALGGITVGIFAVGGLSVGMFSLGGCAIASHIAIGGFANGHIAIGETVKGIRTIAVQHHALMSVKAEQVQNLIHQEFPNLWPVITNLITSIFS